MRAFPEKENANGDSARGGQAKQLDEERQSSVEGNLPDCAAVALCGGGHGTEGRDIDLELAEASPFERVERRGRNEERNRVLF